MKEFARFLSLKVWTPSSVLAMLIAWALLLVPHALGLMSLPGAVAGIGGSAALIHLRLHGWTFSASNLAQKAVLAVVFLCAVFTSGLTAHLMMKIARLG